MSRLLLIFIIACFSASALLAQGSKERTGSTSPQTTLVPSTNASKSAKANTANSSARNTERVATSPQTPQDRTTSSPNSFGNTTAKRLAQDRIVARSSGSKPNRPATYAPPTNSATIKGGTNKTTQKVTPLKSSERGIVNWMTLDQALEKSKTEKRKIFVDMYTDWCGWCKHMDSTTFVNLAVTKYLNEHYYPVKFNAEQEKEIVFKDKTYRFKKNGTRGHHELAALWLNNRLSFPTVVFLDENQQIIQPVPGYQDAIKMEAIINYFGSDSHKKTPWEAYEKAFSNKR